MFYINQDKKKFVNSVNQIVANPISLEYAINDIYLSFKVKDKNSREITLNNTDIFYLAVSTDFLPKTPIVYSSNYTIENNAVTFKISTNTAEYVNDIIQNNSNVNIEIARKTANDQSFHVILQDKILANKRVYVSGQPEPVQVDTYYTKAQVDAEIERVNTYIASNYWDKVEVAQAIASANHLKLQIVETLPPAAEGETLTIYLVPKAARDIHAEYMQGGALPPPVVADGYDEYMLIGGVWEHIGIFDVDLSNYATLDYLSNSYYTKDQTQAKLAAKQNIVADLETIRSNAEKGATAFQVEKVIKRLANYYSNSAIAIDDLDKGLILAVTDSTNNMQIYPDIQYIDDCAIITVDDCTISNSDTWTIYKEKANQINYFDMVIQDAELFGTATNLSNYAVTINRDKIAYWTKNTVVPKTGSIYCVGDAVNNNLWLKIENKDVTNLNLFGLAKNQTINGDMNFYLKNTTGPQNMAFGGASPSIVNGNLNITLDNVHTPQGLMLGTQCIVSGGINWTISSGVFNDATLGTSAASNNYIFYGSFYTTKSNGETANLSHDLKVVVNNGTFNANIYYGPYIRNNGNSRNFSNMTFNTNDYYLELNGGEYTSNNSGGIYAGYAEFANGNNNKLNMHDIKVVINGGTWFDSDNLVNGVGIFAGPIVNANGNNNSVTVNSVYMEMNGGDVSTLFAGGYPENQGGLDILGDVNVFVSGGTVANVLGMSTHSSSIRNKTGYNHVHGNVYIHINGGNIKGMVHPGHRHGQSRYELTADQEKLDGEAYVIISGNTNYNCAFKGNFLHEDSTSAPNCHIVFEDYSGTLTSNAQVIGFKDIVFKKNSHVIFNGDWINNSNSFNLDMSRRSIDYADTLILSGFPAPEVINLTVADTLTSVNDWKLADNISTLPTCNIIYQGDIIATLTAVNTPISGTNTVFDDWGFEIVEGVLRFKRL